MKMLIALDPFGHSHKALEEAVRLAKLQAAELIIVAIAKAFEDMEYSNVGLDGGREALVPLVEKKVEKVRKAALIVMGHRERKGLDHFILGSVATKVVTNSHCSVLVGR